MNVSMQDGFNLGWKLGAVVTGLAPASLLSTYAAERRPVAQQLIDFDKEWSSLMARKPEEISDPEDLATYYLATAEFPSGFMTQYEPGASVVADAAHQERATGFRIGKRFKSAPVTRAADGNVVHLGHHARADGRAKVIYPGGYDEIDVTRVPAIFRPRTGPLHLTDWEKVFATAPNRGNATDIYAERGISRDGAVVVVRPDQYVAGVFPLDGVDGVQELAVFFDAWLL